MVCLHWSFATIARIWKTVTRFLTTNQIVVCRSLRDCYTPN